MSEEMAGAQAAKDAREIALAAFEASHNLLTSLVDEQALIGDIERELKNLENLFTELKEAQTSYLKAAESDEVIREKDFLLAPSKSMGESRAKAGARRVAHDDEQKKLKDAQDKAKKDDRQQAEAAAASREIVSLKAVLAFEQASFEVDICDAVGELQLEDISADVVRAEVEKMTAERDRLKTMMMKIVGLEPGGHHEPMKRSFKAAVQDVYLKRYQSAQKFLMTRATAAATAAVAAAPPAPPVHSAAPRRGSEIKRETVSLPKLSGKEPEAFVEYPIWKKNWEKLITAYPADTKAILLLDHVDKFVKARIVGQEDDYEASLRKIDTYYGNKIKVVECCIKSIASSKLIKGDSDFSGLVSFSQNLETNYKRLEAVGAERELSNTSHTNALVNRLPPQTRDKYMTYFMSKDPLERSDPLPILMEWLEKEREKWEYQEISCRPGAAKGGTNMFTSMWSMAGGREDEDRDSQEEDSSAGEASPSTAGEESDCGGAGGLSED